MTLTLKDIEEAAARISSATINTRFEQSQTLSAIAGNQLYLKFENFQFTASFKERGALNKLLILQQQGEVKGVIAMSAGNHAKAVAYHAQRLGIPATIVMPRNTPNVKIQDTKDFGASVVLHGDTLDEAATHAHQISESKDLVFVHPYNDNEIMAGQGTVALEMLEVEPELDCIVVPVGGGGLIAGVATAAKTINPQIKIIGVEVEAYPSVHNALNGIAHSKGGSTIAEGIAVKQPGDKTLEVIRRLVDDVLVVSEESIEDAINLLLSIEKTVTEGAGAATLAAVLQNQDKFRDLKVALILSGANIDSRILASLLMRRLVNKGRIVRFLVQIDDSPGSLSDVAQAIGEFGGNILDVSHQRMFASVPIKKADLYLTVETRDAEQNQEILARLRELGYEAELIMQ
ncbi:MAG: threonine ammonia-lyase [SAR86 cluster bacterium]|uniref:Threonine ammonia-lyase n=1 Tax=SAR86 cluster bacterium TaxID=2030880 RepID=A0A2A4X9L2_9GAMM|nr:MAG: threonine ammonia-lyase [SAR86 cluster bacterium]